MLTKQDIDDNMLLSDDDTTEVVLPDVEIDPDADTELIAHPMGLDQCFRASPAVRAQMRALVENKAHALNDCNPWWV